MPLHGNLSPPQQPSHHHGMAALALAKAVISTATTVTCHKKNCEHFANHVALVVNLLEKLTGSDFVLLPDMAEPLEDVAEVLQQALALVEMCRDSSCLFMVANGWRVVYNFRRLEQEMNNFTRTEPLVSLVHEFHKQHIKEGLLAIQHDHQEYTLEEQEMLLQNIILKPNRTKRDAKILEISLSNLYPEIKFHEALQDEKEKLQIEFEISQSDNDSNRCRLIEYLIEVTESVANTIPSKKVTKMLVNGPAIVISGATPVAMAETREFKRMEKALPSLLKEQTEKQDNWVLLFFDTLKKQQEVLEKQTQSIEELRQQLNDSKKNVQLPVGSPSEASSSTTLNQTTNSGQGSITTEDYQLPKQTARVEFPCFNGEGFKLWLAKAEQFFLVDETPEELKVNIAVMNLDEKPYEWFDLYSKIRDNTNPLSWEELTKAFSSRFSEQAFEDPMSELKELHQDGPLQEYMDDFVHLSTQVQLSENHLISCFLSGLNPQIQYPIRMFQPKSLTQAYTLAKLQETTLLSSNQNLKITKTSQTVQPSNTYLSTKPTSTLSYPNTTYKSNPNTYQPLAISYIPSQTPQNLQIPKQTQTLNQRTTKRLTPEELEEKRHKEQCFWCDELFDPEHKCRNKKLKMLVMERGEQVVDEESEMLAIDELEKQLAKLTLCSLSNIDHEPDQTMRVIGFCKRRKLSVLIDTGSSSNFINERLARGLNCVLMEIEPVVVTLANGARLHSCYKTGFHWFMEGKEFEAEFYLLSLTANDLVLGIPWLITLRTIQWNFKAMTMEFDWKGTRFRLQGTTKWGFDDV